MADRSMGTRERVPRTIRPDATPGTGSREVGAPKWPLWLSSTTPAHATEQQGAGTESG
eukprot:CAMPEP_0202424184 /NCGR_PEP_ID=MMETSP1128-20130828/51770_1 /ASSEMBLY_ACC=CAM_ASM_000463 /TAXON_ID=3047 /ORGANISM="Dunaliella tertiolecta, Strain CCMP1320" /LENGTH=57 /DNA_ID=CAMNT_0049032327 /DNA_START=624 /DNA_END=797 /DNA_ORIENTATION=-